MRTIYTSTTKQQMKSHYGSLSEKDRRRYAAIEAKKLGHGGIRAIGQLLGCNYRTIKTGLLELQQPSSSPRIRRRGGGRKKAIETIPGINEAFLTIVESHTAGSLANHEPKSTNLTRQQIADLLAEQGINVSVKVVGQLLSKHQIYQINIAIENNYDNE